MIVSFILFLFSSDEYWGYGDIRNNYPKKRMTDSTCSVMIENGLTNYPLGKLVRNDNSIIQLVAYNVNTGLIVSEHYSFDKEERLIYYAIFNKGGKEKVFVWFNRNNNHPQTRGYFNVSLDSIGVDHKNDTFLFFTYPRLPYFTVKPKLIFCNDTINDKDTLYPILNKNCHYIHKLHKKSPVFVYAFFHYDSQANDTQIEISVPFKLDTIKKVRLPAVMDSYYYKKIDYGKYPFVKKSGS